MSRASALVLLVEDGPEGRAILTNKIYEYLGSGRPILALAPEGEASTVIRSARAGLVVSPRDVDAIGKAVQILYHGVQNRTFPRSDASVVADYSRKRQAARFAALLDAGFAAGAGQRDRDVWRGSVTRRRRLRRVAEAPPAWSRPDENEADRPAERKHETTTH